MTELNALIAKRDTLKTRVTRFANFLNDFKNETGIGVLRARTQHFKPIIDDFETIQSQIEDVDGGAKQAEERDYFENQYFKLIAQAEEIETYFVAKRSTFSTPSNLTHNFALPQIKLPELNLPNFKGEYDQWLSFSETYT